MSQYPFGNDPAKIGRYKAFWKRDEVSRPMVGFSIKSWFPLEEFEASRHWPSDGILTPEMVNPDAFMGDQVRLLREGETMDDDIIRGASPSQAVPWLCGMLGSTLRILPGNILAEEQQFSWEEIAEIHLDHSHPWFRKYMEFAETLVKTAAGAFPVTHGTLVGPTDLAAMYRGHTKNLTDLLDEPEKTQEALWQFAEIFKEITEELWKRVPRFAGGYCDAQYQLWTEKPIIRMQEDAIASYSPRTYRKLVQPIDRYLAKHFAGSFMHLHSTSMFILDAFLEIEGLQCFEVNYEVGSGGPDIRGMIPYFQKFQEAERSLIVRGSFTPDEFRALVDSLDPRGLYIYIMVENMKEVENLRPIVGM